VRNSSTRLASTRKRASGAATPEDVEGGRSPSSSFRARRLRERGLARPVAKIGRAASQTRLETCSISGWRYRRLAIAPGMIPRRGGALARSPLWFSAFRTTLFPLYHRGPPFTATRRGISFSEANGNDGIMRSAGESDFELKTRSPTAFSNRVFGLGRFCWLSGGALTYLRAILQFLRDVCF